MPNLTKMGPISSGGRHVSMSLIAIVLLAAFLRLPGLATLPAGFLVDEASTGYDAYSLWLTGRDQYGEFWPLFARSFGDYNESLYRFLTVPAVGLLGLTETAVRLPAALAGTATVAALYGVGKRLLNRRVGLLAAVLLAISPWHVHLSRTGFRAILLPLCVCLSVWLFLKSLDAPRYRPVAAVAFALGFLTYSSARVFIPPLVVCLVLLYRRELVEKMWITGVAAVLLGGAWLFLLPFWLSPEGMARANHNLAAGPAAFLANYLSYFSPTFLFWGGDPNPVLSVPPLGQLYLFEAFTVGAGLVALARTRTRPVWLLGAWLLLYPLPAALTAPTHALRAIVGAPLFALLSALGLAWLVTRFQSGNRRRAAALMLALVIGLHVVAYGRHYVRTYPKLSAYNWQYGMREALAVAQEYPQRSIYVSDKFFLPHIFVLFYTQYPPQAYQRQPVQGLSQGHWFYTDYSLGAYHVQSLRKAVQMDLDQALLIAPPADWEHPEAHPACRNIRTVSTPAGEELVRVYDCHAEPAG